MRRGWQILEVMQTCERMDALAQMQAKHEVSIAGRRCEQWALVCCDDVHFLTFEKLALEHSVGLWGQV